MGRRRWLCPDSSKTMTAVETARVTPEEKAAAPITCAGRCGWWVGERGGGRRKAGSCFGLFGGGRQADEVGEGCGGVSCTAHGPANSQGSKLLMRLLP